MTAQATERRVAAILTLAGECADANNARTKTGLPVLLWDSEEAIIAGLLPHHTPDDAHAVLLDVIDFVFRSRDTDDTGRELSDTDVQAFLESGRAVARRAIAADNLSAGAA
jgi:hypothetical protein